MIEERKKEEPAEEFPLAWIDEYVARLREYVVVREEDNLLIKVPNEAYKLNPSGVSVLKRLLGGDSIFDLWDERGRDPAVRRDLYSFFIGLKQVLQGCVNEQRLPDAVERAPFELGFNVLPVLSEIALTYRCNLKCRFCYAGCTCRKGPPKKEMTTNEVIRVLHMIRQDARVPSTSFTGGEPTLRKDLCQLIAYARHDMGMRVNLITNGTLIDQYTATHLAKAGLHSAQVSLEAPVAAVHDELTGVRGSFELSLSGIRELRLSNIRVHTNTTINRINLPVVEQMPAFVRGLGLERFSMNLVIPCGASALAKDINLKYEEIAEVIPRIQSAAEAEGVEFMWYSPTPICIFNPIPARLGNKGCAACDGLLSVSPAGDVLPCSSWGEPAGNLLKEGFAAVWESVRARWIREKRFAPEFCMKCPDFAVCQGGCPLYWKHFGFEELERYGARHVASTI